MSQTTSDLPTMDTAANTRAALLTAIVDGGGASVAELSQALGFADATVRRHLDRMAMEGLVALSARRRGRGRPASIYAATAAGVLRQRDHSPVLAARLLDGIKHGAASLQGVAERVSDQVADQYRDQVPAGEPLERRVASAARVLREEGILDGWERTVGGYRLHNHACPYQSAAAVSDCICESDRLAIEKLVGATVVQVGRLAQGDTTCEYLIPAPLSSTGGVPTPLDRPLTREGGTPPALHHPAAADPGRRADVPLAL